MPSPGKLRCGVDLASRILHVRTAVADAERRAGRAAGSVRLLAVSKARSSAEVGAAHTAGLAEFGENYVREALGKLPPLAGSGVVWHFIGAIQSNKTKDIARHFHWVHTVDRERVARRLAAAAERTLDVCIQVNVDAEPQKAGVAPEHLPTLADCIAGLPRLRLRGLMVIPRPDGDVRASFRRTRGLFEALAGDTGPHWDTLSMGMSDDFAVAIEEGATIVRIGTAIFGPRTARQEPRAHAETAS